MLGWLKSQHFLKYNFASPKTSQGFGYILIFVRPYIVLSVIIKREYITFLVIILSSLITSLF